MGPGALIQTATPPPRAALSRLREQFRADWPIEYNFGPGAADVYPHINEQGEVHVLWCYYGPGYERGPWPQIRRMIEWLWANTEGDVCYGGDTMDWDELPRCHHRRCRAHPGALRRRRSRSLHRAVQLICNHCGGTGMLPDEPQRCEASIAIGHETISCYATVPHSGHPHMAIVCDPCPDCGGFDECAPSCVLYEAVPERRPTEGWWSWEDGDLAPTRVVSPPGYNRSFAWSVYFAPSDDRTVAKRQQNLIDVDGRWRTFSEMTEAMA